MALSDILQKILEEAKKEIEQTEKESAEKIKVLEKEYQKKEFEKEQEIKESMIKKKNEVDKKMETLVKMEERNEMLVMKQSVLDKVFEKALEKLVSLQDAEYKKVLICFLEKLSKEDEGTIIAAKDRKPITESALHDTGHTLKVREEGNFKGGFVYQSEKIEINSTFENVLKNLKPEIEPEVAEMLFNRK